MLSYRCRGEPFPQPGGGLGQSPRRRPGSCSPAFDDRCANLYEALYYTKNTGESHQELVDTLFRQELPPPADVQKETFQSLADGDSGGGLQPGRGAVCPKPPGGHDGLSTRRTRTPEPLVLSQRRPGYGALPPAAWRRSTGRPFPSALRKPLAQDARLAPPEPGGQAQAGGAHPQT